MDSELGKDAERLAKSGLLLFVIGLAIGGTLSAFTSPRLALSAHTTAVQSGTALIVFGLLWKHTGLATRASKRLANSIWISTYMLAFGLTLAAIFGATRLEPIASGGHQGEPWQELILAIFVLGGSVGMLGACAIWVFLWRSLSSE